MLNGSFVALITPFKEGKVDSKAFKSFINWQISEGTAGLVPAGTTGESPTLTHEEHEHVIETCVETADGRVPVIAGTGANSTHESVRFTRHAKQAGADAALIVTPYYNKPTQAGLYLHYKAIHDEVDIPLIIYNIPGRSVIDMTVETMARLAELPNIIGVKDSTNDLSRPMRTALHCSKSFVQLSGEDATALPHLVAGGSGCISVTANIAPRYCADLQRAWRDRDMDRALELQDRLMPLHLALFCESSPGPVKYAAQMLGRCSSETRLPLCAISESSKNQVQDAMERSGLLS